MPELSIVNRSDNCMDEMPKEIRTERLLLRPFRMSDVDDVFQYAQDPEWARYLHVPQPYLRSDAEEFVALQLEDPSWAIVYQGRMIGGVYLHDPNRRHLTSGIGYSIARTHWSRGIATEAVSAVVAAAFEHTELRRIWAAADPRNVASHRVMEKNGMVREGVFRQNVLVRGEPADTSVYAILRVDWEASMDVMPKEIRTERLLLRPLRMSDVDVVYQYAQDPEWARYLDVPQPYLRSDAEEFVSQQLDYPSWAIVFEGRMVGGVYLHDLDSKRLTAEVGYTVARPHRSRGFATVAVSAVVAAAFEHLKLRRIWAATDPRNVASQRVLEKIGMLREGVLRQNRLVRGEAADTSVYAILRDDWESRADEMPREIRTERLLLRPFRTSDVDDVYDYAHDPEWGRFLPVPKPYLRSDAEEFLRRQLAKKWSEEPDWAVVFDGKVIGGVSLHDPDSEHRSIELGYAVARAHWSRGFTTEAVKAIVAAAFTYLDLKIVWASADVQNIASWRVMEKVGMTRQRVIQQASPSGGSPVDLAIYAISREEWQAKQA
ncbi:MAG: GNAT family N-acetyltransferase [Chloroflexi bacterium]|nr:GNAT family N-acetyltransferase [Chloroflexota bacterium]